MEPSFWHRKWANNETGFHQQDVNHFLRDHLPLLALPTGSRIFVPLCGKSGDMTWLLKEGFTVVGAELSELAVSQYFSGLGVAPQITQVGPFKCFSAPGIVLYAGDIFDLGAEQLGDVAAVYDRAALVALPPEMRARYAVHLATITSQAPQLLVTYDYDQQQLQGPPFAVAAEEVMRLYSPYYQPQVVEEGDVLGGLKGNFPARETAWILQPL